MSRRDDQILNLTGLKIPGKTINELADSYHELHKSGMHGLCFSPYEKGQAPGDRINEKQIRRRMDIIKGHTKWVRSFSCTDGNELIPRIAHEKGLKTLVGAWLGKDDDKNKEEIANLIELAKAGYADVVAVGNEVLYRKDLSQEELLDYIAQVKQALPGIPVGYVDAYYEFGNRPELADACDIILANCYPFWEGCKMDYSLLYMKDMYQRALKAGNGKKVIITETGWPNMGNTFYGAEPSYENAMAYFINTQVWSKEEDIDIFYFSSFDEEWKTKDEGDVGAYWGLWDEDEKQKF